MNNNNQTNGEPCSSEGGALIRTEDLTRVYTMGSEKIYGMHNVNFSVDRGDFVVIKGPSGSGKSTFLNLIGCIDRPTSGEVYFGEQPLSDLNEKELAGLRKERIGLIFQSFNLIPVLSAYENVEYPLLLQQVDRGERKKQVRKLLDAVGLDGLENRRPQKLSGGQRQRVAIARALVGNPELVLADEPTANLDSETGETVMSLMKELNEEFCVAFVVVTHDPLVSQYADRMVKILDGELEEVSDKGQG